MLNSFEITNGFDSQSGAWCHIIHLMHQFVAKYLYKKKENYLKIIVFILFYKIIYKNIILPQLILMQKFRFTIIKLNYYRNIYLTKYINSSPFLLYFCCVGMQSIKRILNICNLTSTCRLRYILFFVRGRKSF